jgi:hypothetical protein
MMKLSGSESPNWNVVGPAIKNFLLKLDFHPPVTGAKPNIAVPLTEHFYGRTEELHTITDHLLHDHIIPSNTYRSTNVIVLSSQISRTGRTQLAAAFAQRRRRSSRASSGLMPRLTPSFESLAMKMQGHWDWLKTSQTELIISTSKSAKNSEITSTKQNVSPRITAYIRLFKS